MRLHAWSLDEIENRAFPGPSAVIRIADSREQLAQIKDLENVVARLDLVFNDATAEFAGVRPPDAQDARSILEFADAHAHLPHLVVQCQVGVGRSQAVVAAILKIKGGDPKQILAKGTYNRRLYRELLAVAGVPRETEPLVSIAVRIKYAPDRLKLFILAMQRQRYDNWELVAVTDGPNKGAVRLVEETGDARIRLIETGERRGRWGHPYRQIGLDACRGEFIGMSNDDNYYVPGYLEQMVMALENADIALCQTVHSYAAWSAKPPGCDLGCWIARASLIRQLPWTGQDFTSDRDYLQALLELAAGKVAVIQKPLFVHN